MRPVSGMQGDCEDVTAAWNRRIVENYEKITVTVIHRADKNVGADHQSHASPRLRSTGLARSCDGFVKQGIQRLRRQVGEFAARLGHGLIEHARFDSILDEFRRSPFFIPPCAPERSAPRCQSPLKPTLSSGLYRSA